MQNIEFPCVSRIGIGVNYAVQSFKFTFERDTLSEDVVSLRTVVTFVTWLISRTEFSSSELVL